MTAWTITQLGDDRAEVETEALRLELRFRADGSLIGIRASPLVRGHALELRELQRLPLHRIASAAAAFLDGDAQGDLCSLWRGPHDVDWWGRFADGAKAVQARGEPLAPSIYSAWGGRVPIGTIYSYIHHARRRGLLPPSPRRRRGRGQE